MAVRTGLSDRPATIEQKARRKPGDRRGAQRPPRRPALAGKGRTRDSVARPCTARIDDKSQDRRSSEGHESLEHGRDGRRIALVSDRSPSRMNGSITNRIAGAGSPRASRKACVCLLWRGRSGLQAQLELILDRSVVRDPVHHLFCTRCRVAWSTAVGSKTAIAWPLPISYQYTELRRSTSVGNGEHPDDVDIC